MIQRKQKKNKKRAKVMVVGDHPKLNEKSKMINQENWKEMIGFQQ